MENNDDTPLGFAYISGGTLADGGIAQTRGRVHSFAAYFLSRFRER